MPIILNVITSVRAKGKKPGEKNRAQTRTAKKKPGDYGFAPGFFRPVFHFRPVFRPVFHFRPIFMWGLIIDVHKCAGLTGPAMSSDLGVILAIELN